MRIVFAGGPGAQEAMDGLLAVSQEQNHGGPVYFDVLQALMVLANYADERFSIQALRGIQDFVREQDPQTLVTVNNFEIMTTHGNIRIDSAFDEFLSDDPDVDRSRHEKNIA